jgi:hypothetical protein
MVAASAALITPGVVLALAGGGGSGALRLMKEGGLGMFGVLALHAFAAVLLAGLGAFVIRGKRIPIAVLFAGALAPLVVSLLAGAYFQRRLLGALGGGAIELGMKLGVLAQGVSELDALVLLGSVASGLLCALAGLVAAVSVVDVDTRRMAPKPGRWIVGAAAGGALALAAVAVRALAPPWGAALADRLPTTLGLGVVLLAAALAGPAAARVAGLGDGEDPSEASRVATAAFASAILFGLGAFLLDRAGFALAERSVLRLVAGFEVDAAERAAKVAAYGPGPSIMARARIADAAAAGLAFAPAIVFGIRYARGRAWISFGATLGVFAVAVLSLAAAGASRRGVFADAEEASAQLRAELPAEPLAFASVASDAQRVYVVHAVVLPSGETKTVHARSYGPLVIAPDRRAPFSKVFDAAVPRVDRPGSAEGSVDVVLVGCAPGATAARLGDYAAFVGPDLTGTLVSFENGQSSLLRLGLTSVEVRQTGPNEALVSVWAPGAGAPPPEAGRVVALSPRPLAVTALRAAARDLPGPPSSVRFVLWPAPSARAEDVSAMLDLVKEAFPPGAPAAGARYVITSDRRHARPSAQP